MFSFLSDFWLFLKQLQAVINKDYARDRVLERVPQGAVCLEIGVWKGDFSHQIIETVKPKKFYLVDPWEFLPNYHNRWYGGKKAKSQKDMDRVYSQVKLRFRGQKAVTIYRNKSEEVVKKFRKEMFDFVYIDGDHSYEFVKKDLITYFPLIKKGGILAGDDYFWGIKEGLPIKRAVGEFSRKTGVDFVVINNQFIFKKK